jgi:hypothetical protein
MRGMMHIASTVSLIRPRALASLSLRIVIVLSDSVSLVVVVSAIHDPSSHYSILVARSTMQLTTAIDHGNEPELRLLLLTNKAAARRRSPGRRDLNTPSPPSARMQSK